MSGGAGQGTMAPLWVEKYGKDFHNVSDISYVGGFSHEKTIHL